MSRLPVLSERAAIIPDKASGFAGNAHVVTLGCSKNRVDSEVMIGVLEGRGFRIIEEPEHADLILVNTCSFLTAAVEESIDTILDLAKMKTEGRCKRLVVSGCLVERYKKGELAVELPEVDRFVSTDELLSVADEGANSDDCLYEARRPYFLYDEAMPRTVSTRGGFAYVKISEGCDRPCTFCIIPKIRGAFRSRSIVSICNEVSNLVGTDTKEINLVAQDLTAYGNDFGRDQSANLLQLLQSLDALPLTSDFWIRLFYAYPIGVTDELLDYIVASKRVVPYLDMPLQHVSKSVLKAMQRPLGEKGTRALIERIRARVPAVALRTTFIVGFPGETDADVEALAAFVGEGHFEHVGVFTYSDESEAASFALPDRIDEAAKFERQRYIMETQAKLVEARHDARIDKIYPVLIEGYHEESELLLKARTNFQGPEADGVVLVGEIDESLGNYDNNLPKLFGRFGKVHINAVAGYDLVGTLVQAD